MADESPEKTESLFNVTPARRRAYLLSFLVLSLIGYGVVIWHHLTDGAPLVNCDGEPHAATTVMSMMLGFAIAHAAAFGLALTTAEITGGTMVIADWLRTKLVVPLQESLREEGRVEGREEGLTKGRQAGLDEGRQEGRVEGRLEGRAEILSDWREWNRRRREAEARGEQFNEPEPYSDET